MRVNIYSQEFTPEFAIVSKHGVNAKGEAEEFKGIRIFLKSPEELHHTLDDVDRSAVTFWLPKSDHRVAEMAEMFYSICGELQHMRLQHMRVFTAPKA